MANYIISDCLGENIEYIVSANTPLVIGEIALFNTTGIYEDGGLLCGTIIQETENSYTHIYLNSSNRNCIDCLSSPYSSLEFKDCETNEIYNLQIQLFSDTYGSLPEYNEIFKIYNIETSGTTCAEFLNVSSNYFEQNWIPDEGPFTSCFSCLNPPRSANTETFLCQEICVSGGTTTISVVPPHPVWTDGYGTQVTQLNMITLGGPNGLNN